MEGKRVQLNFSAAFDNVSHRSLLYKLRSLCVGGQFLSIGLQVFSDSRQRVVDKISVLIDVVSGVLQGSVLEPLLFILYTSELFHIVGKHMVAYANDTTTYAVIRR